MVTAEHREKERGGYREKERERERERERGKEKLFHSHTLSPLTALSGRKL